ncbi:MAG: hypothetical protein RJA55_3179 [Acidobacteriota bacterium]
MLYGGALFIHQYSRVWVDFRGIQDAFARDKGIDYCENSRRATYVQQAYAIRNPLELVGYGEHERSESSVNSSRRMRFA